MFESKTPFESKTFKRVYLTGTVIVWVSIMIATAVILSGTPYFGQMLPILGIGVFWTIVVVLFVLWLVFFALKIGGALIWLLLVLAGVLAWFWQDSLAARERANSAAMEACERLSLQFLDGTVAFARIAWTRGASGWIALSARPAALRRHSA